MIFLLKTRAKVHIISRTRTYLCEKKPKIEKKELFIDLEQKDKRPHSNPKMKPPPQPSPRGGRDYTNATLYQQ